MSSRHVRTAARRLAVAAAATAVAIPLSIAAAGSAAAVDSPLDAVGGLTGGGTGGLPLVGALPVVGDLPAVGDLLGDTSASPTGAADKALAGTPAAGLTKGLPLAGDPLAAATGRTQKGGLEKTVSGLPVAGPLVDQLGVTGIAGGLLDTVTGTVGGVTGGVVGGQGRVPTSHKPSKQPSEKPVRFENSSLPRTGGDADLTALLMCAGLAVAGTGVTLLSRRRGASLLAG